MRVSLFLSVRLTGLEPARRETLDPKSSASTNSATGANRRSQLKLPNYLTKSWRAASMMSSFGSLPYVRS